MDKQHGKDGSGRTGKAGKTAGYDGTKMELRKSIHSTKRTYIRKENNKNKGNKCLEWVEVFSELSLNKNIGSKKPVKSRVASKFV